MNRIALLMEETTQLIVAESDPGNLRQMGSQTDCRPVRESVPERQRVCRERFLHSCDEFGGRTAGASRRLDRAQRINPSLAVHAADAIDREGGATKTPGDGGD